MGTRNQDTDPSTPEALRGLANTDPTPNPATHVSTDPGLGPPSQPATPVAVAAQPYGAPPHRPPSGAPPSLRATQPLPPMGIVVPASAPIPPRKDSVELLLDGMQGPQPARPRMTPQTGGESHAAYHAQHVVHSSRTSPDDEPKVVVERAPLPQTMKIDRARVQAVIAQAEEARRRTAEATAVLPERIAPRVILAAVAGLLVVLALFLVLRLTTRRETGAQAPAAPAAVATANAATTATAPSAPAASAAPSATDAPPASAAAAPGTEASATPARAPAPATASAPWWAQPSARPRPKPTAAPTGDLGDYQTKFR